MLVWCILFSLTVVSAVYTANIYPNKTVNKKNRKCKKQGISKNCLFLYYIQAKCDNITDKNPDAVDDDERTFNYRWPYQA